MNSKAGKAFGHVSRPDAYSRREAMPDPAKVTEAGIKTRESLIWLETEAPAAPEPRLDIDDPMIRQEARKHSRQALRAEAQKLRQTWLDRSRKGRLDFETARGARGHNHERVRE